MSAPRLLFTGSCPSASLLTVFLFLVMLYTAVVGAEISYGSTVRTELRDLLPLYDCPERANRKEQSHTGSAARPNEKDIDIIVTYSDASGAVRAMRVKSDNLSKSWVWKNPSDENDDGKESSKEYEDPFQMEINSENSNQKSKEDVNQYVDGMLLQQASMLHPVKIQRKIQRKERRERRTAELIQHDKEIDNQMQNAAIERAQKLDTTIKGKFNIWRKEYENPNSDSTLKLMRDQIIMARAYATIAKAKNDSTLYNSLMKQSRESQMAMGDASSDAELQPSALERAKEMGHILSTAKDQLYDCITLARKLRAMLQSSEKGLNLLRKKSAFLIQLAAKTVPRPLRCLPLLLTTDYYLRGYEGMDFPKKEKFEDPSLYHYAIFSDNVLATSVVVNSTVLHAKNPEMHVFHVVTDKLNFPAMKTWFLANPPAGATIQVENVDDFTWLNASYCPVLRQLESARMIEYYFKAHHSASLSSGTDNLKYRNPKYLSMLNHLRFYLPEVYPKLDKILFLDDDIVVQKDLTPLWSVDLGGMVNGAVETCKESFHRFDKYLNFSNPKISENFDPNACGWAFGMNMFDLNEWRRWNITGIYHRWQDMNEDRTLWKLGTLPPGLITFYNLTHPLERTWHVLGLGYDPALNKTEMENAAVVHYNGNYKPWLDLAIAKYRTYWSRYVMYDNPYLQFCNINE
ncbi:PREDICTED: probable galacturonosyltransferase 3 isoform X1 [Ipomoea nil]|uniref:probable galacturonosyltransferase 3 isoform X1 n=1 Tax=Ipomoea nil TaxID=35883 RepID=UPI000901BF9F|nr:PREDICTED: probable galacturonosyltransferase 3 isoform X1 [Ipomoea nil]